MPFFGGSALKRTGKAVRSWLSFFIAIPFLVLIEQGIALKPALRLEYAFQNINHIGIAIILAVSLNLVNGLTGQFSIGHAGFMAVGGYVSAVMLMRGPPEDPYRLVFLAPLPARARAPAPARRLVGQAPPPPRGG